MTTTNQKAYWRIVTWAGVKAPKTIFATRAAAEEKLVELERRSAATTGQGGEYHPGSCCNIRGYLTRKGAVNADASDDQGYIR